MQKLILFDIDGTLIQIGRSVHGRAFEYAVKKITGCEVDLKVADPYGRIDNSIFRDMFIFAGMTHDEALKTLNYGYDIMFDYYTEKEIDLKPYVLPGVVKCIKLLKEKGFFIALLTGNHEKIAWHKLKMAGLNKYFTFGAFGNEAMERPELVDIALKKAEDKLNIHFDKNNVFIIGDTPRDIQCGKLNNVKTIGVATGSFSKEDLTCEGADLVLDNLEPVELLLDFIVKF